VSVYGQAASLNRENFVVDSKMCTVEMMDVPYPWEAVSPLYGRGMFHLVTSLT